ncbi:MAG: beta-galactosidase [Chloroflexota bacterium]|nr:beta-galactosidase [Chloroflexota bacterium]MDE2929946.1 beta-galactosidase [Chloroflexota bacterium]
MAREMPWYDQFIRFGQVVLHEADPPHVDIDWWQERWRENGFGGVALSAGGVLAFYPTEVPFHRRSRWLGERDVFGEMVEAAKKQDLVVLARIDPSLGHEDLYYAHADWFMVDHSGSPRSDNGLYYTCINSPYYREYLPAIVREIAEKYPVDGFLGHNWQGHREICYCTSCEKRYAREAEMRLPPPISASANAEEERAHRSWQRWRREVDEELWSFLDRVTKEARANTLWVGDTTQGRVASLAEFVVGQHEGGHGGNPLWTAGLVSRKTRGVAGGGKAAYVTINAGSGAAGAIPPATTPVTLAEILAHGAWPWTSIAAVPRDRRVFKEMAPVLAWQSQQQQLLGGRVPGATVGVVYADSDDANAISGFNSHVMGACLALLRARIPFDLVELERIQAGALQDYQVIVLPNISELSDGHCQQIRSAVSSGRSLVATFETSRRDTSGEYRTDFGLGDVFGVSATGNAPLGSLENAQYQIGGDHPIVQPFADTIVLPAAARLSLVQPLTRTDTPLVLVPPAPAEPAEFALSELPAISRPVIFAREQEQSRIVYFPGDIDHAIWQQNEIDLAGLLASAVRWAHGSELPVTVEGPGLVDIGVHIFGNMLQVHLVNLTSADAWRGTVDEVVTVGAQELRVVLQPGNAVQEAQLLVSGASAEYSVSDNVLKVTVPQLGTHELVTVRFVAEAG